MHGSSSLLALNYTANVSISCNFRCLINRNEGIFDEFIFQQLFDRICCITMGLRQHGRLAVLRKQPALQKLEIYSNTTTTSLVITPDLHS